MTRTANDAIVSEMNGLLRWLGCLSFLTLARCGGEPLKEPPLSSQNVVVVPHASTTAPKPTASQAPLDGPPPMAPVPVWRVTGSDPSGMTLRCENAFPPEDGSGHCVCEGFELNPCVNGIRKLMIDRKQCIFQCNASSTDNKTIALGCPDGTTITASSAGCSCNNGIAMNPCVGAPVSAQVSGRSCNVTCQSAP